jgi:hypothetical protein
VIDFSAPTATKTCIPRNDIVDPEFLSLDLQIALLVKCAAVNDSIACFRHVDVASYSVVACS